MPVFWRIWDWQAATRVLSSTLQTMSDRLYFKINSSITQITTIWAYRPIQSMNEMQNETKRYHNAMAPETLGDHVTITEADLTESTQTLPHLFSNISLIDGVWNLDANWIMCLQMILLDLATTNILTWQISNLQSSARTSVFRVLKELKTSELRWQNKKWKMSFFRQFYFHNFILIIF